VGVSKQKTKARRQKKVVRKQKAKDKKQKEMAKEGETEPSVSEGQAGEAKPGELIGTTAG